MVGEEKKRGKSLTGQVKAHLDHKEKLARPESWR